MAYHKDGFIHSIPDEVIADMSQLVHLMRLVEDGSQILTGSREAAQRLEKYIQDYKKLNDPDRI